MEQTTRETEPPSYQEFVDLWRENSILYKRIEFLEARLRQREEVTRKDYQKLRKYFDVMKGKVMDIFMDLPASMGLSISKEERTEIFIGLVWRRQDNLSITDLP